MDALAVLQRLGGGYFIEQLGIAISQVAEEVVMTGNPGSVSVRLNISREQMGDPTVIIKEAIGRTPPKDASRGAMFYVIDSELHREDPRQAKLEFHTVEPSTTDVRTPADDDVEVRNA